MSNQSQFIYVTLNGSVGFHNVESSIVTKTHLQGFTALGFRTFRLDRILQEVNLEDDIDELIKIHANHSLPVTPKRQKKKLEICFTGFKAALKNELTSKASIAGMHIAKSVTVDLDFLCVFGELTPANANLNKKLNRAREQGTLLINDSQFIHLIETGEILDE